MSDASDLSDQSDQSDSSDVRRLSRNRVPNARRWTQWIQRTGARLILHPDP